MSDNKKITEIIDMNLSGRGIGKDDGKIVFIPDTVTGDTVAYSIEKSEKRYNIGKLEDILTHSEYRCTPECDIFAECGGCTFQNITREYELNVKRRAVEAAFRRAGIKDIYVEKVLSDNNRNYRNKAVFHRNSDGKYGFFTASTYKGSSCENCIIVPQIFNKIIKYASEFYYKSETSNPPESIMLRLGTNEVMITSQVEKFGETADFLTAASEMFPEIKSAYECIGYSGEYESRFKLHSGNAYIHTVFNGIQLGISPKSFFQINNIISEKLCGEICKSLSPQKGDLIMDLYCGIGTIGLTVAKRFPDARILGIEINKSAVEDAKNNAKKSSIYNAEFVCSDAGHYKFENGYPYAVIVDPPRYGLTKSMIKVILKMQPEILIYMSCDPGTLAGDTSKLISGGYTVTNCIIGDMFPECSHIESLLTFRKA